MATTPIGEGASLPLAALAARCEGIERELVIRKLVVPEALATMRPGGAENTDESPEGWLVYFGYLTRLHAAQGAAPAARTADVSLHDALERATGAMPEHVRFEDGRVRGVHPKSYLTLRFLDDLDDLLRVEAATVLELDGAPLAEWLAVRIHGRALESKAVQLWLWVLTTPGSGLPFDPTDRDPAPPEWTALASPEDIIRVAEAHLRVHAQRLAIISAAFPPDRASGTSRLTLAGFIGAMAHESGARGAELMGTWTLGEIFAQSASAARGAKEAERRHRPVGSGEEE